MEDNQSSLFSGATQAQSGYRLQALEVFNWGTFHHKIWQILPQTENALLTGDIGSGKSTLVDAITTLLVPHHKIVFNAAAGAQNKERTIRSYILGEYKNVREGGFGINAKSVSLREANSTYTVLIARFENQGLDEQVSLAQVFWIEDGKDRKFFIVAKGALSFKTNFSNFGSDVMQLKSRLRKSEGIEVFDSFKDYNQRFRQYFGMSNDKTLQLFYQTVSMKSVDNLTLFVRQHMLEEPDARDQLDHLLQNFENLQQAHEAVMKARKQMNLLQPIVKEGKIYEQASNKLRTFEEGRMALPMYVAEKKLAVLQEALDQTKEALLSSEGELQQVDKDIQYINNQIDEIRNDYLELGGNRINLLKNNIESLEQEKLKRRNQANRYEGTAHQLNLTSPENHQQFEQNKKQANERSYSLSEEKQQLTNEQIDLKIAQRNQTEALIAEQTELDSLKSRKNQIPEQLIRLRAEMTKALGLEENEIPFAGELLQVKEAENDWEGAIERVLHGFGLSLLVSEANYHAVSQYIDRTNLKGRLVYFRTTKSLNRSYDA
ncbi:MAG: ATP-binding protein, partial [Bacteroidota bacterium]